MEHVDQYFDEVTQIAARIDRDEIERIVDGLVSLRDRNGRLFLVGVGGSAGNCGHAVNDFRKLCGIEAYAPTDNVSELTARANDEGWETIFSGWLKVSRASSNDALLVFSVGGGDIERNISVNLVRAVDFARERGMAIFGVIGRETGYVKKMGDAVLVVPPVNPARITPHSEAFQAVVWHCMVSHPRLQEMGTKWENQPVAAPVKV